MNLKLKIGSGNFKNVAADVMAVPIFEDEVRNAPDFAGLDRATGGLIWELLRSGEFRARRGDSSMLARPGPIKARRLLLCGAGTRAAFDPDALRQSLGQAVARVRHVEFKQVAVWSRGLLDEPAAAAAAVEALVLASYDAEEYKSRPSGKMSVSKVLFLSSGRGAGKRIMESMEKAKIVADCTNFSRHLTNQPGNVITPVELAEQARQLARQMGLGFKMLNERQMEKKGMQALLGVARGSLAPPRMIVLHYRPRGADNQRPALGPLALVGKGVTFDTGGISIKPAQSMEEMKADKAGGCAVLGVMRAVAQLRPKREIIGIIPAVENMPSGTAQRPGDVVRSSSGKTIEVINTDAEGRLILADALTYALELGAKEIVDIATLTGACVVALGHICAGLFCSDADLQRRLMEASRRTGEKLWPLPLFDEYKREIQSDIADIKNVGSRWGGAIFAAKFLQEFVGQTPWAHLDIAGVDLFKDETSPFKGPTGFGVRTLTELCMM